VLSVCRRLARRVSQPPRTRFERQGYASGSATAAFLSAEFHSSRIKPARLAPPAAESDAPGLHGMPAYVPKGTAGPWSSTIQGCEVETSDAEARHRLVQLDSQ
jgi:hypothetical protein